MGDSVLLSNRVHRHMNVAILSVLFCLFCVAQKRASLPCDDSVFCAKAPAAGFQVKRHRRRSVCFCDLRVFKFNSCFSGH